MKLYTNETINPYFNLASEEYFIDHTNEDVILLWRNAPAVVIGKNQNTFAEINLDYTAAHQIAVVRRLTGGGAVFHDLGNVNFTFISPPQGRLSGGMKKTGLDFAYFAEPVIEALRGLGVEAALSGRNDLMVGDRKISGNAQCVRNGVTMHHGTLLFSADLSSMQGALNVDPTKLKSKGIVSVRSRVANLQELIPAEYAGKVPDAQAFMYYLAEAFAARYPLTKERFPTEVREKIQALADSKYSTDAWNLHRKGSFEIRRAKRFPFGKLELSLDVHEGTIAALVISGDFFGVREPEELAEKLRGVLYSRDAVEETLREFPIEAYISGCTKEELIAVLFDQDAVC